MIAPLKVVDVDQLMVDHGQHQLRLTFGPGEKHVLGGDGSPTGLVTELLRLARTGAAAEEAAREGDLNTPLINFLQAANRDWERMLVS